MEREQAETYVKNTMISMPQGKWFILAALLCVVFAIPCLAIYHDIIYIVITAIMIFSAVIICIVGGSKKYRNEYIFSVLGTTVILILCTLFNLLMYGISMYISNFVWWAYMILIFFELVALIGSLFINKLIVKKVSNNKGNAYRVSIALSAGIFGHGLASVLMYIFRPSENIIGFVLVSLICICVCLFILVATSQIYRASLIRKFDIKFDT